MDSGLKTLSPHKPAPTKSPWGSPMPATPTCSLASVMDEELARSFQAEEEKLSKKEMERSAPSDSPVTNEELPTNGGEESTDSDFLLAQMLQLEFDKEHDRQLTAEEKHYNKQSRVKISFDNYRSLHPAYLNHQEEEEEGEVDDEYEMTVRIPRSSGRKKGVSPGQPTKHDSKICGRKNVRNMEKFPPDFPMGDVQPGLCLDNSVFNVLKEHSMREEKHSHRHHEKKEHSTQEHVLDPKTRLMLFKMVDSGKLGEVNGCLSTGKEAAVYHAEGGGELEDGTPVPDECAIKIFKTTLNEFFRRDKYIKEDYRFKNRFGKQNPRKIVRLWAEKEMHNLKRLHSHGIHCPKVVLLKKHVLVMSFIGKDQVPAPKLKDSQLTQDQLKSAYHQCVQTMEKMYNDCHLVHADLNEFNMLWFEGRIYIIDVSQSVEPSHPHGLEFLLRDCKNVSTYFSKKGLAETLSHQDLFNKITGLGISAVDDQEFLTQIRAYTQRQQLLDVIYDKKEPYPFDFFFEETMNSRQDDSGSIGVDVKGGKKDLNESKSSESNEEELLSENEEDTNSDSTDED